MKLNNKDDVKVKIGQTYLDTKTLYLRKVLKVAFGYVHYLVYIKDRNVWINQTMPHYMFKERIGEGRFTVYLGENPSHQWQELDV